MALPHIARHHWLRRVADVPPSPYRPPLVISGRLAVVCVSMATLAVIFGLMVAYATGFRNGVAQRTLRSTVRTLEQAAPYMERRQECLEAMVKLEECEK